MTLHQSMFRKNEDIERAVQEIERAFITRIFEETGKILHVFGVRLWLARIGAIPRTVEEVVQEARAYVEDLYKSGRLEPYSWIERRDFLRGRSYGGLGYLELETEAFREIFSFLEDTRKQVARDRYPALARELLLQMKNAPDTFYQRVSNEDAPDNLRYSPVLAALDPGAFVSVFFDPQSGSRLTILSALHYRYEMNTLERDLKDERDWILQVRNELLARADILPPVPRANLKALLGDTLDPVLKAAGLLPLTESASDPSDAPGL